MAELIPEHSRTVREDDTVYIVRVYGDERANGTWEGWLQFHPTDKNKPVLRTEEETSQPSRVTIEYLAYGLEPTYLEGGRARKGGYRAALNTLTCSKRGVSTGSERA